MSSKNRTDGAPETVDESRSWLSGMRSKQIAQNRCLERLIIEPYFRLEINQRSFRYILDTTQNNISDDNRTIGALDSFRRYLKRYIFRVLLLLTDSLSMPKNNIVLHIEQNESSLSIYLYYIDYLLLLLFVFFSPFSRVFENCKLVWNGWKDFHSLLKVLLKKTALPLCMAMDFHWNK